MLKLIIIVGKLSRNKASRINKKIKLVRGPVNTTTKLVKNKFLRNVKLLLMNYWKWNHRLIRVNTKHNKFFPTPWKQI